MSCQQKPPSLSFIELSWKKAKCFNPGATVTLPSYRCPEMKSWMTRDCLTEERGLYLQTLPYSQRSPSTLLFCCSSWETSVICIDTSNFIMNNHDTLIDMFVWHQPSCQIIYEQTTYNFNPSDPATWQPTTQSRGSAGLLSADCSANLSANLVFLNLGPKFTCLGV